MSVSIEDSAFVTTGAQPINLASMISVTARSSDPAYLVVTGLDRDGYPAGATGATGTFSGNGHTDTFSGIGGDARGAGVVFTYQASTGLYYNSTYGYLNQMTYTSSGSANDITNISIFGTSNLSLANAYANNAYGMMQNDASGYLGSVTVATQPAFHGTVPTQATPNSIATTAESFVGQAWTMYGCWTLASTFGGKIPSTASGTVTLEVVTADSNHNTAADIFNVTFTHSTLNSKLIGVASLTSVTGAHMLHA